MIIISKEINNPFSTNNQILRQKWVFHLFDFNLVFTSYIVEERMKGKFKETHRWDKFKDYTNSIKEEPVLEQHIKNEALDKIKSMIKVVTWDEFKK